MSMIITPFDKLIEEATEIQRVLEIAIEDDISDATNKGCLLVQYQARSGKMLSDAKYHLNTVMCSESMEIIKKIIDKKYSAKVQNALIESAAREQRALVDWVDRINSACTHQIDFCRTIISKEKELLRLQGQFEK